jgi:hypothetical protein
MVMLWGYFSDISTPFFIFLLCVVINGLAVWATKKQISSTHIPYTKPSFCLLMLMTAQTVYENLFLFFYSTL